MDAILVELPFAKLIINGEKKYDFRKLKPPTDKIGVALYLIANDFVIGEIMITSCRYNQIKHSYYWQYQIIKKYQKPKKITSIVKNGDWGKDVELNEIKNK